LGADIKAGNLIFSGTKFLGNISNGVFIDEVAPVDSFPGAVEPLTSRVFFDGCVSEFNGGPGINLTRVGLVKVSGGIYSNNGTDTSFADTTRSGIVASTAARLLVVGSSLGDDQAFTVADGISFQPGTTTSNRYTVQTPRPRAYSPGQRLLLVDAGGAGVDLNGKIVAIDGEEVTLEFAAPATFSSTGNTSALSGTWSGSGRTLTGVSGAALTEIVGPTWVTDGSQWRLVERVNSDNSIGVSEAFSPALSSSSLSILTVDVEGIPSQQYGMRIFGAVASYFLAGNTYQGNVLERHLLSTPANAEPGTEYYRKTKATTNASPVALQSNIQIGHRLLGWATNNTVAISGGGATSFSLEHATSAGSVRETLTAGTALALNTKTRGSCAGVASSVVNDRLQATFAGGTPSAGQITVEATYRVDALPALPSV
jgi:hypothetical protein